nr:MULTISPECIES: MFS transporter [unclassified Rhodococcus (in: high G+C Gram-positive bacteria)]
MPGQRCVGPRCVIRTGRSRICHRVKTSCGLVRARSPPPRAPSTACVGSDAGVTSTGWSPPADWRRPRKCAARPKSPIRLRNPPSAIVGGLIASRVADRRHPKKIIAATFGLATLSLTVLTAQFPFAMLLLAVAGAGVGAAIGTQVLICGFVSNYDPTKARAVGVAWCAGFGRLGGIFGTLIGGFLEDAGVSPAVAFYISTGVALVGAVVTFAVSDRRQPNSRTGNENRSPTTAFHTRISRDGLRSGSADVRFEACVRISRERTTCRAQRGRSGERRTSYAEPRVPQPIR